MLPKLTAPLRLVLLGVALLAVPRLSLAQAPLPDQMCGNGTTIHGRPTWQANRDRRSYGHASRVSTCRPSGRRLDHAPNGCSIYAFLVGGYKENPEFNEVMFYTLAEFVAKNNGYCTCAWWNNLLRARTWQRPLHTEKRSRSIDCSLSSNRSTSRRGPKTPTHRWQTVALFADHRRHAEGQSGRRLSVPERYRPASSKPSSCITPRPSWSSPATAWGAPLSCVSAAIRQSRSTCSRRSMRGITATSRSG